MMPLFKSQLLPAEDEEDEPLSQIQHHIIQHSIQEIISSIPTPPPANHLSFYYCKPSDKRYEKISYLKDSSNLSKQMLVSQTARSTKPKLQNSTTPKCPSSNGKTSQKKRGKQSQKKDPVRQFGLVFDELDSDRDGFVSSSKMGLGKLPQCLIEALSPLLLQIKNGMRDLSREEFIKKGKWFWQGMPSGGRRVLNSYKREKSKEQRTRTITIR